MLDFMLVSTKIDKSGFVDIYPKFIVKKSQDLMIRGSDFYAIWVDDKKLWSTNEQDAIRMIDSELDIYVNQNKDRLGSGYRVLHMWDADSGMIDKWHRYVNKQLRDNFHQLDEKLIFSNTDTKKDDYASKKLPYPLESGEPAAWNEMMATLYSEEERHKIEWAIGSIVNGSSKSLEKFLVLYGAQGTGKSTVIHVIEKLFEGYTTVFDAKALGSSNAAFALEPFKANPLVAIQHDGDLSFIEDNTRLNSLVSHETMTVNEKFKSAYANRFVSFLIMGTNKPVKITDAKSGLMRRLIDVSPTGNRLPRHEYDRLTGAISFELGKIAKRCKDIYEEDPSYYDEYRPLNMLGASNTFYDYIQESSFIFVKEGSVTLADAWEMYCAYCEKSKVPKQMQKMIFKEELKNYFAEYADRKTLDDGTRVRSYYSGFKTKMLEAAKPKKDISKKKPSGWIVFDGVSSEFDKLCADCPAQLATTDETPGAPWDSVTTTLKDIDTSKTHYVRPPVVHIVADFDIPDENGNKSLEKNLEAANKWPPTYAELSKSGCGIHLHYIYTGKNLRDLSRVFAEHIEIKIFTGKSSLRRKLTKFNSLKVAEISSGLPFKEVKETLNKDICMTVKGLRTSIVKCLRKEVHKDTHSNVQFIFKLLEDAYASELKYDVSDMADAITAFAAGSTNHSTDCLKMVSKMHFKSEDDDLYDNIESDRKKPIAVFDLESMINEFVLGYMDIRSKEAHAIIDPTPAVCQKFIDTYDLIGFNNRKYDNHLLYARAYLGFDNERCYKLTNSIIKDKKGFISEAYGLSLMDLYDVASKKQSLKKWEIEMGKKNSNIGLHKELGLRWDEPVPENMKQLVADYCKNDVLATKALYFELAADTNAREILADLSGLTLNDKTNTHTTKMIFGNNRKPQSSFQYRNLALPVRPDTDDWEGFAFDLDGEPTAERYTSSTLPVGYSIKPFFPGYKKEKGISTYRGEVVGEGGYVYAEPNHWYNVALLDITSMHPSTIDAENFFGDYTVRYTDIVKARVFIKHQDYESAGKLFGGKLKKWLTDESSAKKLSKALKIAINSVYGLTAAKFDNPFKDPRNTDNFVAKRGALFMVNLKHAVQKRGFTVAHIKTDSIKIPNATPEIIQFVMDYGKRYGYSFEHEATYERMCLVNDSTYIARYDKPHNEDGKDIWWVATAMQFQIPYVYKTLFSKEPIEFYDLCETKSVEDTALYLDCNEGYPDVRAFERQYEALDDLLKVAHGDDADAFEKAVKKYCKRYGGSVESFLASDDPTVLILEGMGILHREIAKGHNYRFVGKVGLFCPVMDGVGGGILLREHSDRTGYSAANGSKGHRWLESVDVMNKGLVGQVDLGYFNTLVTEAVSAISKYGDYEQFMANNPCELKG